MLLAEFGTGQVFWSMVWFTLFFMWIWIVIAIFSDIFRSDDLGGWGKTLWCIFVIFLPYLGVFVYLIARGRGMQERTMRQAANQEKQFRTYVQDVASTSTTSPSEEVARLADLLQRGVLTQAEYDQAKARALA